jgi:hypothetical protein
MRTPTYWKHSEEIWSQPNSALERRREYRTFNEQEAISKSEEIVRKEENTNPRVATSILDQNLRALFPPARCEDVDAMEMSKSKLRKVRCGKSERESSRRRCRAICVRPVHTQQNTGPLLGDPKCT